MNNIIIEYDDGVLTCAEKLSDEDTLELLEIANKNSSQNKFYLNNLKENIKDIKKEIDIISAKIEKAKENKFEKENIDKEK